MNRRRFLATGFLMALGCCLEFSPFAAISEAASESTSNKSARKTKTATSGKKTSRKKGSDAARSRKTLDPATPNQARTTPDTSPEGTVLNRNRQPEARALPEDQARPQTRPEAVPKPLQQSLENEPDMAPASSGTARITELPKDTPEDVRDYLTKMRNYDASFPGDVILPPAEQQVLNSVMARLDRLQGHIGHGHFYLLGLDEAIRYAKRPSIGEFTRQELYFLEQLFHVDAAAYGFMDKKPLKAFTATIARNQVTKVPGMGNYIYKDSALEKWHEINSILGDQVVLTSGVRGVIKQFYLFLAKAQRNGGNMSLASRSLAPPGYSFHAVGDFDVGQRGFGVHNFMAEFTTTPVYQQLSERGYISLRYPRDNFLGVRFEPWHVKVTS